MANVLIGVRVSAEEEATLTALARENCTSRPSILRLALRRLTQNERAGNENTDVAGKVRQATGDAQTNN